MMPHHTTEELKQILRTGTYHIIAVGSFENFSTRSLSKHVGLSDPYIYRCYRSTTELLLDCFYVFDKKIAMEMKKAIHSKLAPSVTKDEIWCQSQSIWCAWWKYLLSNAEETFFYWRFLNSSYYTAEVRAERQKYYKEVTNFIRLIDRKYAVSSRANLRIMLDNLISSTVTNAVRVIQGKIENTEKNVNTVFDMVFLPIFQQLDTDKPKGNGLCRIK